MNSTPNALRRHIALFGAANAGKSALFNKILNQQMAIVSEKKGTTTDPVSKAMELIGFGPVVFVDTAGLCDGTDLGILREKKTLEVLKKTDFALLLIDYNEYNPEIYENVREDFKKYNVPFKIIISKADTLSDELRKKAEKEFEKPLFVSVNDEETIDKLKAFLTTELKNMPEEKSLIDGLLQKGDEAVLVIPVDSEAPKGRLILPQVQLIRECLDKGVICHIARDTELPALLGSLKKVDLVVCDSQIFKKVNEIVKPEIKLTSFSMLMARQKGDFATLKKGVSAVESLKDNDKILIAEVCTHTTSHEDIGRVKIPKMLMEKTGKKLNFEFSSGFDFPKDIEKYKLIIHCGGCMITRKAMLQRLSYISEKNIPVVNYGVLLSYLTGAYGRQKFLD